MTVLLAGATGQLGAELGAAFPGNHWSLVRARPRQAGIARLRALRPERTADRVVEGDVTVPNWGLDELQIARLAEDVDCIVNASGLTDWAAPVSELTATNVAGPVHGVGLAAALHEHSGRQITVLHIGSAFAAGGESPLVTEELHPLGSEVTAYERSKWEGERTLLRLPPRSGVTRAVARVSALAGGAASSSLLRGQGPAALVRAADSRGWATLPGDGAARVDIVHTTTAARCVTALSEVPLEDGAIFHVVLGEEAPSLAAVVTAINDERRRSGRPPFRLVPVPSRAIRGAVSAADRFVPLERRARNTLLAFRYLASTRVFGRSRLRSALGPSALPHSDASAIARTLVGGPEEEDEQPSGPFAYFGR